MVLVVVAHKGVKEIAEFILHNVLFGVLFRHRRRDAQWAVAYVVGHKLKGGDLFRLQTWK